MSSQVAPFALMNDVSESQLLCWFRINEIIELLWDHDLTVAKIDELEKRVAFFVPLFRVAFPRHGYKQKVRDLFS